MYGLHPHRLDEVVREKTANISIKNKSTIWTQNWPQSSTAVVITITYHITWKRQT